MDNIYGIDGEIRQKQTEIEDIKNRIKEIEHSNTSASNYTEGNKLAEELAEKQRELELLEASREEQINILASENGNQNKEVNEANTNENSIAEKVPADENVEASNQSDAEETITDEEKVAILRNTIAEHEKRYNEIIEEMRSIYDNYENSINDGPYTTEELDKREAEFYTSMNKLNNEYEYEKSLLEESRNALVTLEAKKPEEPLRLTGPVQEKEEDKPITKEEKATILRNTIAEHEKKYRDIVKEMKDFYDNYVEEMTSDLHTAEELDKKKADFLATMNKLNNEYEYEKSLLEESRNALSKLENDPTKEPLRLTGPVMKLDNPEDSISHKVEDDKPKDKEADGVGSKPEEPIAEDKEENYRSLEEILTDIRTVEENGEIGFASVSKSQAKRYDASNIKITKMFKNEVQNGNWVYNIFSLAPAAIHLAVNAVRKLVGKVFTKPETKARIEAMKENIDNLSDADLEVLTREYKGATAKNFVTNEPIDNYIKEAIVRYQYKNEIEPRREALKANFDKLIDEYDTYKTYETLIKESKAKGIPVSDDIYAKLEENAAGKAKLIKEILDEQTELQNLQSNGIHGLDEDIRAKHSKMSRKGKRFAKDYDTAADEKLLREEARLKSNLAKAIRNNDDKQALENYIKYLKLEASNTEHTRSFGMERSTGLREFDPLVEELDYRQDMLIRNILTTAVLAGTIVNVVSNISNMHAADELEKNSAEVNKYGDRASVDGRDIKSGLEADRAQTEASIQNTNELTDDRANEWNLASDSYRTSDLAHHAEAEELFETTKDRITELNEKYSGQEIDAEYLREMAAINSDLHSEYGNALTEGLEVLESYAAKHPDIELDALISNYKSIMNNQQGIEDIQNAAIDSVGTGEELTRLSLEELRNVSTIDRNIGMSWAPMIAALLLAGYSADQAKEYYAKSNEDILDKIRTLNEVDNGMRKQVVDERLNSAKEEPPVEEGPEIKEEKEESTEDEEVEENSEEEPEVEAEQEEEEATPEAEEDSEDEEAEENSEEEPEVEAKPEEEEATPEAEEDSENEEVEENSEEEREETPEESEQRYIDFDDMMTDFESKHTEATFDSNAPTQSLDPEDVEQEEGLFDRIRNAIRGRRR